MEGTLLSSFLAYDVSFNGGIQVAAADLNNDGKDDIITATGAGASGEIKGFSGLTLGNETTLFDFMPYGSRYTDGLTVAGLTFPVPEPGGALSLLCGAIPLLLLRRRDP